MYGFEYDDDGELEIIDSCSPLYRQFGVNEETKRPAENDTIDGMRERKHERERELFVVRTKRKKKTFNESRVLTTASPEATNKSNWLARAC